MSAAAEHLDSLTPGQLAATVDHLYRWDTWARKDQMAPGGSWSVWTVLAGRGWGKTRTGAEWVRSRVQAGARRIALVAPISAETRDVMVEGESGLLSCFPPSQRPVYEPSKRRVTFQGGAQAFLYSADEPDRLRGPQHDTLWADELAAWKYPETWDLSQFGLRLSADPRALVTTTPKPTKLVKALIADPGCVVTRGSTFDNADNLPQSFFDSITRRYEGTRLGRQELYAEILEDIDGAIVTRDMIDESRFWNGAEARVERAKVGFPGVPDGLIGRTVVGVDPAVTSGEDADQTGIVVVGKDCDGHAYVLEDLSCRMSPDGWARRAVEAYHRHSADRIVVERNNGGEMVEMTIRQVDRNVPITTVVASRGKHVRFEPVGALYEQGRVHHVGTFPDLEDQVCSFTPAGYEGTDSPDRADALVWAVTNLCVKGTWDFGDLYG